MKEIKFRAKSIDGEWVYGDLHLRCNIPHIHTDLKRKVPIDVSTIGQFTGFYRKDKEGKKVEVYEGDIIQVKGGTLNLNYISYVRWDCQGGCWHLRDDLKLFVALGLLNEEFVTVIGNIHDDPSLKETCQ